MPETADVECAHQDCTATFKGHRWGYIKADDWFHQKDGTSWCPAHHPEWVAGWRARKLLEPGAQPTT